MARWGAGGKGEKKKKNTSNWIAFSHQEKKSLSIPFVSPFFFEWYLVVRSVGHWDSSSYLSPKVRIVMHNTVDKHSDIRSGPLNKVK